MPEEAEVAQVQQDCRAGLKAFKPRLLRGFIDDAQHLGHCSIQETVAASAERLLASGNGLRRLEAAWVRIMLGM